jgi:hypothetical protein
MRASVLLLLIAAVTRGGVGPELRIGYRGEAGVESKLVCTALGHATAANVLLSAGVAASLFQHPGVSAYGLTVDTRLLGQVIGGRQLRAAAFAQHEQWNDWRTGENRAGATLRFLPNPCVLIGAGAAYRAPVFDPARYASPFWWVSPQPEWNLLYDVRWRFLQQPGWSVNAFVANVGPLTLHNPQQIPFGLEAGWWPRRHWTVTGRAGTAVNGVSALLLSLSELTLELGARYAP